MERVGANVWISITTQDQMNCACHAIINAPHVLGRVQVARHVGQTEAQRRRVRFPMGFMTMDCLRPVLPVITRVERVPTRQRVLRVILLIVLENWCQLHLTAPVKTDILSHSLQTLSFVRVVIPLALSVPVPTPILHVLPVY
jgi:hypothetical protein